MLIWSTGGRLHDSSTGNFDDRSPCLFDFDFTLPIHCHEHYCWQRNHCHTVFNFRDRYQGASGFYRIHNRSHNMLWDRRVSPFIISYVTALHDRKASSRPDLFISTLSSANSIHRVYLTTTCYVTDVTTVSSGSTVVLRKLRILLIHRFALTLS
jgi:hypothetical protein